MWGPSVALARAQRGLAWPRGISLHGSYPRPAKGGRTAADLMSCRTASYPPTGKRPLNNVIVTTIEGAIKGRNLLLQAVTHQIAYVVLLLAAIS